MFTADPKAVRRVAEAKKLSGPYLEKIWKAMIAPGDSPMLQGLAAEWRRRSPGTGSGWPRRSSDGSLSCGCSGRLATSNRGRVENGRTSSTRRCV
ncbi:MAG: hypothetical protein Ct9H300mP1_28000 [Planctomycetaceae bacterium]|nr:MAG: hypothetical protein Ct9H300mP1_28000 [Planctomycetaceae bacterium]